MRVLAGGVPHAGGVATHIRHVKEGLERLGVNVDVFWGSPTQRRIPGPAANFRAGKMLARAAINGSYDVVAAHGSEGALLDPRGPARVVTSHGDPREGWKALLAYLPVPVRQRIVTPYLGLPLFRRAVKRADVVIALHETEAAKFRAERRQDPSTVHVVPNGCGALHAEAEPVPGKIVFLGNWLPRKGSLIIPDIFRFVRQANPNASLTVVGADASVQTRFHKEDQVQVRALGFVNPSEAERALLSSDVLLLPSFFEGMPLAVLEALSFGVPTVGFDIPGTAAAAGEAGVLVAPGDLYACARALVRLIGDRGLRERLSQEAFARAERFTWAATADGTLAAYEHAASVSQSR